MTKHFPAICSKHFHVQIYNKNGILLHRQVTGCDADFIGIFTRDYQKWLRRQRKEEKGDTSNKKKKVE